MLLAEGTAKQNKGKGLTYMYGVRNNSVNFPAGYNNYGKNAPERSEARGAAEKNRKERPESKRSDEILFSAVQNKENETYLKLSDKAKSYLNELSKKYPGYAFMIADYETDEEASRILSEGRGEINVLITPDLLEKMASDEATGVKYEGIIDGAADRFAEINENLTEGGKSIVERLGITVNADGTTSVYAFLKKSITGEDGSDVVSSTLVNEFTDMLNALAEAREKMLEEKQSAPDKPVDKEEEKEKSVLPPKSFEKYKKEPDPYSTEEDFGGLPPESFEKYRSKEEPYSTEEDYGTLPPESFKKYEEAAAAAAEAETKPAEAEVQMNFTV